MFNVKKFHYGKFAVFFFFVLLLVSLFDIKKVKGSSMLSSFKENDILLIFRAMYGIKSPFSNKYLVRWLDVERGDVVMYKIRGHYVIKRCYATDEDSIYFYQKNNIENLEYFMKIKGKEIKIDRFSYYRLFLDYSDSTTEGMQEVPRGSLLLLGDNISSSFDSKDYGYVTQDSILGKVIQWN